MCLNSSTSTRTSANSNNKRNKRRSPRRTRASYYYYYTYNCRQFHVFCGLLIVLALISIYRCSFSSFSTYNSTTAARLRTTTITTTTTTTSDTTRTTLHKNTEEEEEEWIDFAEDYEKRFHRSPPDGFDSWLTFAKNNQCETRRFYNHLDQDLDYFRRRPSSSTTTRNNQTTLLQWNRVIPEGLQITDNYIAFQLQHHKLTVLKYQTEKRHEEAIERLLRWMLQPVVEHSPPLDSIFMFNLHDTATQQSAHATYPLFSVCKMDYYTDHHHHQGPPSASSSSQQHLLLEHNEESDNLQQSITSKGNDFVASKDLLVPWHFSLRFISQKMWHWPFYSNGPPFEKRKDVITWRGSTTGTWEVGPRFKLVREWGGTGIHPLNGNSNSNSTTTDVVKADFAFLKIVQKPKDVRTLSPGYRFARHMFYREMQHGKYVLDIDGNGFTSRFPGLLRSGSVVFKSTRYREWFHGILQPYVDYIPVDYDLSDLVEKVEWMHQQPLQVAERITQHGRQQVERFLRPVDMQCYMYRLLLEYQTLFEKPQ